MIRLTAKQEAFVQATMAGKRPSEAYRTAYDTNGSPKVVSVKAAEVLRRADVQERLAELRAKLDARQTLSRERKRAILHKMVENGDDQKTAEQLRAIEIDNRMAGHNEPDQVEVSGFSTIIDKIRKGARKP